MTGVTRRRVALWTPWLPQAGALPTYSFEVTRLLARHHDIVVVVEDRWADRRWVDQVGMAGADGVEMVGASAYRAGSVRGADVDVYQLADSPACLYSYRAALEQPGLLVLHDPGLADFHALLAGGRESVAYRDEVRYNQDRSPGRGDGYGGGEPLLSGRLVDASLLTLVHCPDAVAELTGGHRSPPVRYVHPPVEVERGAPDRPREVDAPLVVGVFGALARPNQALEVLDAFARVRRDHPGGALVVADQADQPEVVTRVEALVERRGLGGAVRVATGLSLTALRRELRACDLAVMVGEGATTEAATTVLRALGAGKPVVVAEDGAYAHLDRTFCWTVPGDGGDRAAGLERVLRWALAAPESVRGVGEAARSFVEAQATVPAVVEAYLEAIEEAVHRRTSAQRREAVTVSGEPLGVNAVADWKGTTGLSEAARRCVVALLDAGVEVSLVDRRTGERQSEARLPERLSRLPTGRRHGIDINYFNVDQFQLLSDRFLRPPGRATYVIGYWAWELPRVAYRVARNIERVDELWVGSRFTKQAFQGHTDRPVQVMPHFLEPAPAGGCTRADFGLPEEACLFFFGFDVQSTMGRKNPLGVIEAFSRAFSAAERAGPARLVLKTLNLANYPEARALLVKELGSVNGILVEDDLSSGEMFALMTLCDVYVSLHRSEGFGLGMAEAMYLGRPVIATGYSGNMDFMTVTNSCPVGYRLESVGTTVSQYNPGMSVVYEDDQLWGAADVHQAARWMRRLYESPATRERIGSKGAATIRHRYSRAAAGAAMVQRLTEVAKLNAAR
ncbi:MAG TPA: glycosyltransferase [Acidimicrobiales bacterium]|nr:glycosyltransferase [Acidimicrobiales bacterium]